MYRILMMAVTLLVVFCTGYFAGRFHPWADRTENGDAVAGLVMGAYNDAIARKYPAPAPAPDELNIALTVCDARKAMAVADPLLVNRDQCAARTLGWEAYMSEAVHASRNGRKIVPPPAGE